MCIRTPPQFVDLPAELINLVASFLERRDAAALMLASKSFIYPVKGVVWRRLSGIDALFNLLPFTKRTDFKREGKRDWTCVDWDDEEEDAIVIGSGKNYDCSSYISQKDLECMVGYAQHVRVLEVHESTGSPCFHGLKALFPFAPLTPKLQSLIMSPQDTELITLEKEIDVILELCSTSALRKVSVVRGTKNNAAAIDVNQGSDILRVLGMHKLKLTELEISLFMFSHTSPNLPAPEGFYPLLEYLTRVTLDAMALMFLPMSFLFTLPHLKMIKVDQLRSISEPVTPPSVGTWSFPGSGHMHLDGPAIEAVSELLAPEILPYSCFHTLIIDNLCWNRNEDDISAMLESLERQKTTLQALEIHLGFLVPFTLSERDIIALSALPNITHFASSSFLIDNPTQILNILRGWPSLQILSIPAQEIDVKILEGMVSACPKLSHLSFRLTGLHSLSARPGATLPLPSHCSPISPGSINIKCDLVEEIDWEHASSLAR